MYLRLHSKSARAAPSRAPRAVSLGPRGVLIAAEQ